MALLTRKEGWTIGCLSHSVMVDRPIGFRGGEGLAENNFKVLFIVLFVAVLEMLNGSMVGGVFADIIILWWYFYCCPGAGALHVAVCQ